MRNAEIAEIRKSFPKFSKAAASLASRTCETGVTLCQKARLIARRTVFESTHEITPAENSNRFKTGLTEANRTKPYRYVVRVDEETYRICQKRKSELRLNTQDYLYMLIKEDLKDVKETAV